VLIGDTFWWFHKEAFLIILNPVYKVAITNQKEKEGCSGGQRKYRIDNEVIS
jgi:hypothetical protein